MITVGWLIRVTLLPSFLGQMSLKIITFIISILFVVCGTEQNQLCYYRKGKPRCETGLVQSHPARCAAYCQIWTNEACSDCAVLHALPPHRYPWRADYIKQLLRSFIISEPSISFSLDTSCSYIISLNIFQETWKEMPIFLSHLQKVNSFLPRLKLQLPSILQRKQNKLHITYLLQNDTEVKQMHHEK